MWHLLQAQKSRGVKLSVFGGAVKLSWFKIVRYQIVRGVKLYGVKLSAVSNCTWCQIVSGADAFFWDTLLQRPFLASSPCTFYHLMKMTTGWQWLGEGVHSSAFANIDWNLHLDLPGSILINQTIFNISSFGEKVEIEIVASARFLLKLKPICILAKHCDWTLFRI